VSETQDWDTFFSDMETGDVILMHGLFNSSIFIEAVSECDYSHAAIVVMSQDIDVEGIEPGIPLLFESNIESAPNPNHYKVEDVILHKAKSGPILDLLRQRISVNYALKDDSNVAKRKLTVSRNPEMYAQLKQVISAIHADDFPAIPVGEMTNYLKGRLANSPVTDSSFFCSQLVAHTYKAWGLLTSEHVDNWYAPACFADGKWQVALEGSANLGPPILLNTSTIPAPE
jgi:hypothetical protein